jgi:hypothetical protein
MRVLAVRPFGGTRVVALWWSLAGGSREPARRPRRQRKAPAVATAEVRCGRGRERLVPGGPGNAQQPGSATAGKSRLRANWATSLRLRRRRHARFPHDEARAPNSWGPQETGSLPPVCGSSGVGAHPNRLRMVYHAAAAPAVWESRNLSARPATLARHAAERGRQVNISRVLNRHEAAGHRGRSCLAPRSDVSAERGLARSVRLDSPARRRAGSSSREPPARPRNATHEISAFVRMTVVARGVASLVSTPEGS